MEGWLATLTNQGGQYVRRAYGPFPTKEEALAAVPRLRSLKVAKSTDRVWVGQVGGKSEEIR